MAELTANEKEKLVALVKRAIGSDTQAVFAQKAGISSFNLSRILSEAGNQRPQRSTLCKIAAASEGRATEEQLMIACGYEKQDSSWDTETKDIASICADITNDLTAGIQQMTGTAMKYASIDDFLDNLKLTRIRKWNAVVKSEEYEYKQFGHNNAEQMVHIRFRYVFSEKKISVNILMTLFFCKTTKGGYIFSDAAFDLETLLNAGHPGAGKFLFEKAAEGDMDYSDYPIVFSVEELGDAAKLLLQRIFGE